MIFKPAEMKLRRRFVSPHIRPRTRSSNSKFLNERRQRNASGNSTRKQTMLERSNGNGKYNEISAD
jgi:hypothetical protein